MYVLFGSKCIKLFCGPMWSSEPTEQGSASVDVCRDPVKVCNIESSQGTSVYRYKLIIIRHG